MCRAEYAKDIDRNVFPGIQGGPLMHVVAGKAVCFGEALAPEFKQYAQQIIDNAKTLAEALLAGGVRLVSGGTENHLMLADVTAAGALPASRPKRRWALCDHGEQEHDSLRPAQAARSLGHSHRHACADHARHGRGEMRRIGGWILEVLRAPDDQRLQRADSRRGFGAVRAVSRCRPRHWSPVEERSLSPVDQPTGVASRGGAANSGKTSRSLPVPRQSSRPRCAKAAS